MKIKDFIYNGTSVKGTAKYEYTDCPFICYSKFIVTTRFKTADTLAVKCPNFGQGVRTRPLLIVTNLESISAFSVPPLLVLRLPCIIGRNTGISYRNQSINPIIIKERIISLLYLLLFKLF